MIHVFRPKVRTEEILQELKPVLESGWIGLGPKTAEFERRLQAYLDVGHVVATNSCTSALHLAIRALSLPSKAKVLTTPITFVSTNHALLYEGLEPVFYDVDKLTGNASYESIEFGVLNYNIKAIMVVHLGGYSADMDRINTLAKKYNIPIIEDCAHAFGATYKDKKVGNTNNICTWSFHAVKNMPLGEGGALSTNNEEIAERIRKLRWLGIDKDTISRSQNLKYKWEYDVEEVGYKYHMSDIAATIGLVGLKHIEEDNKRREEIARFYLDNLNCILPDYDLEKRMSSFHFVPLFFENREEVYDRLVENDIHPGMHYKRNDKYDCYKNCLKINKCENAQWYEDHELTLPLHLELTKDDLLKIKSVINA